MWFARYNNLLRFGEVKVKRDHQLRHGAGRLLQLLAKRGHTIRVVGNGRDVHANSGKRQAA